MYQTWHHQGKAFSMTKEKGLPDAAKIFVTDDLMLKQM